MSTPTARGQFHAFDPDTDSDEDDSFTHFRPFRVPYNRLEDTSLYSLPPRLESPDQDYSNNWKHTEASVFKYVDDFIAAEKIRIQNGCHAFSTRRTEIQVLARQCEDFFHNVSKNAAEVGMTVNALKTQLVCISPASHHHVTSFINVDNGNKISSQTQLKQLGFWFSDKPNVDVHIEHIISKFRKRIWIVRHMKKAKIPSEDLRGIYQCFLLPIMDNSCVIYHSLMTNEQAARLE